MGQGGRYWNDLEAVFGKGNLTSGYRTQEEQDALVRQGATRATRSSHTYEDGYDIKISAAKNPEEIRQRAATRGLTIGNVRRESGHGRNQGTGPHWHVELAMGGPTTPNGRAINTANPGGGVASPQAFLDGLQSNLAPESAHSEGVSSQVEHTFNAGPELEQRADTAEGALVQQGEMIDQLTVLQDAAQATQLASMSQMVDDTRAISNEITSGVEQLRRQTQPVFQARGRIADQLDKLNTMNPLERGLRSIFDLNYDRGFLENQLKHYNTTLEMRANDFDYVNKLHEAAMGEIERRYSLDNAIPGLLVDQMQEDLGVVGLRVQQTANMLGSLKDRVSTEASLISAQALAREDMLSRLDGPTVMGLANQAKQGNGVVSHNGVQFSYGELRDRLERDEDQELNREAHRMAIASGRMDIAEKYATNIARSYTRQQAEAAIANGGVDPATGILLPQDVLQNVYQNHLQTAAAQAESLATTLPSSIALRTGSAELQRIVDIQRRTRTMFGGTGIEGMATYLTNGTQMINALLAATKDGSPPEVVTALTAQIAANSKKVDAALDQALLRQAGGNKEAAGYLKSFVMGAPMDSAASVQAITYFAVNGSRPDGIAMSPESKQVFQQAERLVRSIRDEDPKISNANLRQRIASQLGDYAARAVGQARFERVSGSIPQLAQRAGNPLGKLSQSAWSRVRATATTDAYSAVANSLGVSVDQVRRMRSTGKPLGTTQEDRDLFARFQKEIPRFNATEQAALIRELDELPALRPGTRNSTHLIDFMQSPELARQAEIYTRATGSESFGDYVVNPIVSGSLENMLTTEGASLQEAQSATTLAQRQTTRTVAAAYSNDPRMRTRIVLQGIPGVGKDGALKLMPHINSFIESHDAQFWEGQGDRAHGPSDPNAIPFFGNNPRVSYDGPLEFQNSRMVREDSAVLSFLQQTKFQDATLEGYRKAAVKSWHDYSTQTNSFVQNMIDAITG